MASVLPDDVHDSFTIEPYTDNCKEVCAQAEHVLVGVSPGNGYFNKERLMALMNWVNSMFAAVDLIVPDISLVHTYRAIGHSYESAQKYARQKSGQMCRRIARAREAVGIAPDRQPIRLLSEFSAHPVYTRLRAQAERAIGLDAGLRRVLLDGTRKVLSGHLKGVRPTRQQIEEGMRYLIAELPMIMDTPRIMAVPSSVAIYHQRLEFIAETFAAEHLEISPSQAHAVVTPCARQGDAA